MIASTGGLTFKMLTYAIHNRNNYAKYFLNRFVVKLFKTDNRDAVFSYCRMQFNFELPSALAQKRSSRAQAYFIIKYSVSCM